MWILKIFIKIILKRIPFSYSIWKKLGIFKHGKMDNYDYAKNLFFGHLEDMRTIYAQENPIIMEIGPGDSIASAICAKIYNPQKVYLIDVASYANKDIDFYKKFIKKINNEDIDLGISPDDFNSFSQLLDLCKASYLTNGLASFKEIETDTVDYIFSHSVLEHVRTSEINTLIKEMYRILKKETGVMDHNINYKDHLDESLNSLRFPKSFWESSLIANSGFYTNRIPASEMHQFFVKQGFNVFNEKFGRWPSLPIKRKFLHKDYNRFSNEDLMIPTSSFLAKK